MRNLNPMVNTWLEGYQQRGGMSRFRGGFSTWEMTLEISSRKKRYQVCRCHFFPSIPASSFMPDFQKYIWQQHSESQDMDGTSIDSNYTQKMQQHAKHLHKFCLWLHKNFEKDTSFATYVFKEISSRKKRYQVCQCHFFPLNPSE